ncbi:hypothetical protein [Thalassorhabdomicrobium marinisediminis]|uniref:DUF3299 domain-containing protein n=2 Tax=Thalassorhabdomicrobium marinisediminis TaxID=2170577 RepID=A0A2T7G1R9_9RHOB|nr:hypothetical protein [Thalassorhabdomicrobium marinisediminis]PVA08359.1 hypothetical protein DC363_00310 [Thalassorhabdomicrobium marinisediminis]
MKTSASLIALSTPLALTAGSLWADASPAPWDLLKAIEIEEIVTDTSYEVRKNFPASVENGIAQFDITGFVVPLFGDETGLTEIVLVSDMGFCPFCGSPEHGTNLRVSLAEPLIGVEEGARISLRGALEPVTDSETWETMILTGARVL